MERKNLLEIYKEIESIQIPERWKKENVIAPNKNSKDLAKKIVSMIFNNINYLPEYIVATIEEGVYLRYSINNKEVIIEAYNDSTMAMLISKGKNILHSTDTIKSLNNLRQLLFKNSNPQNDKKLSLEEKVTKIKEYGTKWQDEDIAVGPNKSAISKLENLTSHLLEINLMPIRITPSIEEGICIAFLNDNKLAYLEIYNDETIGLLIEDIEHKKIIANIDLIESDIIPTLKQYLLIDLDKLIKSVDDTIIDERHANELKRRLDEKEKEFEEDADKKKISKEFLTREYNI